MKRRRKGKRKPQIQIDFGRRVRALREQTELSQEAFAARIGLDRSYYAAIERGERNLTLSAIERIARGLGVPVGDLFN